MFRYGGICFTHREAKKGKIRKKHMRKLTATTLQNLPEGNHPDHLIPGLSIRVGKARKTWVLRFRQGGKQHRENIGYFPELSLADAREKARGLLERIESGAPVTAKPPVHPKVAVKLTLGGLLDRWEAARLKEGHRVRSLAARLGVARRYLAPYAAIAAEDFSKRDLRAARDEVAEKYPTQANRLLSITSVILQWAAEEDIIPTNFARDIRHSRHEKSRDRILSPAEIKAIWKACGSLGTFGRFVRFLLTTGLRKDEARLLKYGEILDGVVRLKPERVKSNREHRLPLSPLALALAGKGEARECVFAGHFGSDKPADFGMRPKHRLDKLSGVTGWTLHDLRRTCASGLQELGVEPHIIAAVLNHSLIGGATGIYMRASMDGQKKAALEQWAAHLQRLVGAKSIAKV
jgi:integrase